jgi:hypothetical protein
VRIKGFLVKNINTKMKKTLLTLLMICPLFLWAQADKYTKKAAEQTCDCLSKKDIKSIKKSSDATAIIGQCFVAGDFMANFDKIAAENKIDASKGMNAESGRQVGEKVGVKLAEIGCSSYMQLIKIYMNEESKNNPNDKTEAVSSQNENAAFSVDYLTLLRIEKTDNLNFLIFKDSKGKEIKIWWLEYFKGAEKLKEKDVVGKQLKCTIIEKEFYNPKIEDYVKVKIIKELDTIK